MSGIRNRRRNESIIATFVQRDDDLAYAPNAIRA